MKYLLLFLLPLLFTTHLKAQPLLKFNQRFAQCEDKWIAFPATSTGRDSSYSYGLIYIDPTAGLSINIQGTFKIRKDGVFVPKKNAVADLKAPLQPNNVRVALIPSSKFAELQIVPVPAWLAVLKQDTTSIAHLVRWGYLYNAYEEYPKALTYLEAAQKIDPNYKDLQYELGYAYNALGKYNLAIPVLQNAVSSTPKETDAYKELVYAQMKSGNMDQAAETYQAANKASNDKEGKAEIAFEIASEYFTKKDKEKFEYWAAETKKNSKRDKTYDFDLSRMEFELSK